MFLILTVKKLKINITYVAIMFTLLLIHFLSCDLVIPLIFSILIHEIGHIVAILSLGGKISSITANAGGLKISYNSQILSYKHDLIYALGGPLFGFISAIIASNLGFTVFSGIAICINLFNLIPVRPLDGGKILCNLLMLLMKKDPVKIITIIEIMLITAMYICSVYLYRLTGTLSLFFISCVLTFYYCKER